MSSISKLSKTLIRKRSERKLKKLYNELNLKQFNNDYSLLNKEIQSNEDEDFTHLRSKSASFNKDKKKKTSSNEINPFFLLEKKMDFKFNEINNTLIEMKSSINNNNTLLTNILLINIYKDDLIPEESKNLIKDNLKNQINNFLNINIDSIIKSQNNASIREKTDFVRLKNDGISDVGSTDNINMNNDNLKRNFGTTINYNINKTFNEKVRVYESNDKKKNPIRRRHSIINNKSFSQNRSLYKEFTNKSTNKNSNLKVNNKKYIKNKNTNIKNKKNNSNNNSEASDGRNMENKIEFKKYELAKNKIKFNAKKTNQPKKNKPSTKTYFYRYSLKMNNDSSQSEKSNRDKQNPFSGPYSKDSNSSSSKNK